MELFTIDFKHDYYKLDREIFTTIRGKSWADKLKVGQHVCITKNRDFYFNGKIHGLTLMKIKKIPLIVLRHDADFPGFRIRSYEDFVNLLNSFRRSFMPQANFNSQVTVIYIQRIKNSKIKSKTPLLDYLNDLEEISDGPIPKITLGGVSFE